MPTTQQTSELQLTPTGQTITHRGRVFTIHKTTHPDAESPWVLESSKGICYILIRNKHTPHQMFGIHETSMKCLPGWFSDKSGNLVSLG